MNKEQKVLLLTVVAAIVIFGLYIFLNKNRSVRVDDLSGTMELVTKAEVNSDKWHTYTNEKAGFSFEYPGNWSTRDVKKEEEIVGKTFFDEHSNLMMSFRSPILETGYEELQHISTTRVNPILKADLDTFIYSQDPTRKIQHLVWNMNNWSDSGEIWFTQDPSHPENESVFAGVVNSLKALREINPANNEKAVTIPSYVFSSSPRSANVSNVVGYIAEGAFVMYVPDWIVEHWKTTDNLGGNVYTFTPSESIADKDFSDIVIDVTRLTETNNAETLYSTNNNILYGNPNILVNEVLLNITGDMRIYHFEYRNGGRIYDTYYMDGNNYLGILRFNASETNYQFYGPKVRSFVEGFGKGQGEQG